jgi:hypothetical protein
MSGRLTEIQRQVGVTRQRLEDWARRLAALRERIATPRGDARPGERPADTSPRSPGAPLFHALGVGGGTLDDVELHFEVLDTEDPGREGR